jgi:hypothetical protein
LSVVLKAKAVNSLLPLRAEQMEKFSMSDIDIARRLVELAIQEGATLRSWEEKTPTGWSVDAFRVHRAYSLTVGKTVEVTRFDPSITHRGNLPYAAILRGFEGTPEEGVYIEYGVLVCAVIKMLEAGVKIETRRGGIDPLGGYTKRNVFGSSSFDLDLIINCPLNGQGTMKAQG